MINAYNPIILHHWKANMDLQMIEGPYGVAFYVCIYICKAEPDILRQSLSDLLRDIQLTSPALSLQRRLYRIGMCVLKTRTLSAQEAAYRIGHLQLIWNSRTTISTSAYPPYKQFRRLKKKADIESLPPNSTDVLYGNTVDHYHKRPSSLSSICLFTFLSKI